MRKRADDVEATRRRITEAAVDLHTSVGPAHTTISALAEKAGVTRLTVYRHFPDDETLFRACSEHWFTAHPPPDAARWREIRDPRERIKCAIREQYEWYRRNGDDLFPLRRDESAAPRAVLHDFRAAEAQHIDLLLQGVDLPVSALRRLHAVTAHVLDFWTWYSLTVRKGLETHEAADIAVRFFTACLDAASAS